MPVATRALIIWNPAAGRSPARAHIDELARELQRGGWKIETAETQARGGAVPSAEYGLQGGFDAIVVCGGDGTLHEVVNGIARGPASGGPAPVLAIAPMGTANIMAHALGTPAARPAFARWLLRQARPRVLPLGCSMGAGGERYFIAVASAGGDAQVVHQLHVRTKLRWGKLAYAAGAASAWRRYRPIPLQLEIDGRPAGANGVIFALTGLYGGRMRLGRYVPGEAILLGYRGGRLHLAMQALWLAAAQLESAPGVERWHGAELRIRTAGVPVELDGEPAGFTPVTWKLCPAAVTMLAGEAR